MEPERGLSVQAPARLKDHQVASATWRRMMRTYTQLKATVVTRMDWDLLVSYCMLTEELSEISDMRRSAREIWMQMEESRKEALNKNKPETFDPAKALLLANQEIETYEMIVKLDGRSDRKRDLIYKFEQSLYLTPRARSAAVPAKKEKPEEPDELEKLLDDFEEKLVDGKQDGK
jgi:phage terminase small subunit